MYCPECGCEMGIESYVELDPETSDTAEIQYECPECGAVEIVIED